MLAVNLTGVFLCTQAALPDMLAARSGRIVNIASTAGQTRLCLLRRLRGRQARRDRPDALARARGRAAGHHGQRRLPRLHRHRHPARRRRRIVAATGRNESEALATFSKASPLQRLVEPDEVAATVLWLCADAPAAFTGQAMSVSGGEVMN